MDLRDLRYFEKIAEHGHVGQAAESVHRSQPTLTGSVHRLEESCGVPLLEKVGRGIRITAAGQVLLKWARLIRHDVERAQAEMAAVGQGLSGNVRLGVVPTAARSLLPAAVRQLLAEAPGVTLKVSIGLVDSLAPMLQSGSLDLIVATEHTHDPSIRNEVLAEDHVVVAASGNHPIFAGSPRLSDLARYKWVLQPRGGPTRDWLEYTLERHRVPGPRVQVESSMLALMPPMVAGTHLLTFMPRNHLNMSTGHAPLREVEIDELTMRRSLVISTRATTFVPPAAERVTALLKEAAAQCGMRPQPCIAD